MCTYLPPSAIPVAQGSVWAVPLLRPCLPGPSQPPLPARAVGMAPAAGESQTAKTEVASIPIWEDRCPHLWLLCPVGSAGAHSPSRQPLPNKARGQALFVPCGPGVECLVYQYLLPPHVLYSGPTGLPLLHLGLDTTILSRPSLDLDRRTVGPKHTEPSPVRLWPRMLRNRNLTLTERVGVGGGVGRGKKKGKTEMLSNLVKETKKMEKGEMKTRPLTSHTTLFPPQHDPLGNKSYF